MVLIQVPSQGVLAAIHAWSSRLLRQIKEVSGKLQLPIHYSQGIKITANIHPSLVTKAQTTSPVPRLHFGLPALSSFNGIKLPFPLQLMQKGYRVSGCVAWASPGAHLEAGMETGEWDDVLPRSVCLLLYSYFYWAGEMA